MKKKYNLYKKYLNTLSDDDGRNYIHKINECNRMIRKAKRKHEKSLAEGSKIDPKMFWRYVQCKVKNIGGISPLQGELGHLSVTNIDKANTLNSYFSTVFVQENVNTLPKTELGDKSKGIILSEIRVTPEAIIEKLNKLNKGKVQGPDKVPPKVLMELSRELSVPLNILFNKSLEEGKIPSEWKSANVVAIFKKGTKSSPGNYRPVSLTCVICKLLESFIRDVIVDHMNLYAIYSNCQHGFRKHRSCVTQLLKVMEDFTKLIEEKSDFDIIYLDFRKAFDQVPHQRLLSKLSSVGITGNIHKWLADLVSDRNQRVRVGNSYSRTAKVLSGIPQGSILGPILFTIFINDLPKWVSSNCTIFADDTKLYNVTANCVQLQDDIDELQTVSNYRMTLMIYKNGLKCGICILMQTNAK